MIRFQSRALQLIAIAMFSVMPVGTFAHDIRLGDLSFSGAFTRAMPSSAKTGGGYVTITNKGTESDRLVSASSPAAPMVQIHEMKMEGDVMRIGELPDGIEIPPGETVTLAPGGAHIMFMNVPEPFAEGDEVAVTLTFQKSGRIDLVFDVQPVGATEAPKHHGDH